MLPQVPFTTHLLPGVLGSLSRLLHAPEHWSDGNEQAGTSALGKLGSRKGRACAALTVILPRPLGAWGVGVPPQALGTHLRWPCVGSCWGGPAGAACGTCLHLVSPAGGLGVGTRSSCSDIAGMGRGASYKPSPHLGLAGVRLDPSASVTWYCPGPSWTGAVLFQPSSPYASCRPGCLKSLESSFLPGGHGG